MHCSRCEKEEVFTMLNGNSLCQHCYQETDVDERKDVILEIRDNVKKILKKLEKTEISEPY